MLTSFWSFLLTLTILIAVHEWGHYRAAVSCGVKVLRFSIGFGPVLWRRQGAETEFVVSAFPLGGYVRMLDEREAPVDPSERHRAFNRKPLWQRSWVVFAGPLANLVLALLLYASTFWMGVQVARPVIGTPVAASPAERAKPSRPISSSDRSATRPCRLSSAGSPETGATAPWAGRRSTSLLDPGTWVAPDPPPRARTLDCGSI